MDTCMAELDKREIVELKSSGLWEDDKGTDELFREGIRATKRYRARKGRWSVVGWRGGCAGLGGGNRVGLLFV